MAIVSADLKFLSSERMTDAMLSSPDTSSGGGFAALPVVQDGVSNNVFPDVMPSDRLTGRRQMRLVYPAILSNENSLGSNLQYAEVERPSDVNVEIVAFAEAGMNNGQVTYTPSQRRSAYWAGLAVEQFRMAGATTPPATVASLAYGGAVPLQGVRADYVSSAGGLVTFNDLTPGAVLQLGSTLKVGDKVRVASIEFGGGSIATSSVVEWATVAAVDVGAGTFSITHPAVAVASGATLWVYKYDVLPFQVSSPALLTVALSPSGQNATVDRLEARVHPAGATAATPGFASGAAALSGYAGPYNGGGPVDSNNAVVGGTAFSRGGNVPIFQAGRKVLLQHPTVPATREVRMVEHVNYVTGVVTLTTGVTNTYPIGSVITALIDLGNAQAAVSLTPFFQQAWTRTWADTLSGVPIAARYNGTIAMNNAGGRDDRWAIVFTSATMFECHSETLGLIAVGNTGSDFSPINPMTSQPYFTLFSANWTTGWLPNNVVRFNTTLAGAGVWRSRVVSPGATSGTSQGSMAIRVDVDA